MQNVNSSKPTKARPSLWACLTLGALLLAPSVWANDTAVHDGHTGPTPIGGKHGPESVIRMVRERLEISFGREGTTVKATFVFRSTKTGAPARQTVGFPDRTAMAAEETFEQDFSGPIEDLQTFVDGEERSARKLRAWVRERDGFDEPAKAGDDGAFERIWHAIDVEFPVGREVVIERRYRVPNGTSVAGPPQAFFEYTTATGGVWKGTIGEMVAEVTLLDGLTVKDLLWAEGGVSPPRKAWQEIAPNRLRLVWKDFEPRTQADRRGFRLAVPLGS